MSTFLEERIILEFTVYVGCIWNKQKRRCWKKYINLLQSHFNIVALSSSVNKAYLLYSTVVTDTLFSDYPSHEWKLM